MHKSAVDMKHTKFALKVYSLLGFSTDNIHLKLNYSAVVCILCTDSAAISFVISHLAYTFMLPSG